jgi:hypothetical protein
VEEATSRLRSYYHYFAHHRKMRKSVRWPYLGLHEALRIVAYSSEKVFAVIHSLSESVNSRKLIFTTTNPYPIGPGQSDASHPDNRSSQDILLHGWIDIHSNLKNLRL